MEFDVLPLIDIMKLMDLS